MQCPCTCFAAGPFYISPFTETSLPVRQADGRVSRRHRADVQRHCIRWGSLIPQRRINLGGSNLRRKQLQIAGCHLANRNVELRGSPRMIPPLTKLLLICSNCNWMKWVNWVWNWHYCVACTCVAYVFLFIFLVLVFFQFQLSLFLSVF